MVSFVTDNQVIEETVKDALNAFGYPVVMLVLIDSSRKCMDAYGKERTEEDWESITPDENDAWFDDYTDSALN